MGTWINSDGLVVKLGTAEAVATRIGEFAEVSDGWHTYEAHLKYTDLAAFGTKTVLDYYVKMPSGMYIERVAVFVKTAFTSAGSATLDFGLERALDNGVTEIDSNGIIAAVPKATLSVGAIVDLVKGSTYAGALIGTVTDATYAGLFSATAGTANFTAGEATIMVKGRIINSHTG